MHDAGQWSLVLDSDMLFFRKPTELLEWMTGPSSGIFIEDVMRSYGYSDQLMHELAVGPLPDRMNVGLYGVHGSLIDYDYLEFCCAKQLAGEGPSYLQEQALTALLFSKLPAKCLARADYVVMPSDDEGRHPTAILHHYVAESKRFYFQSSWRNVYAKIQLEMNQG